MGIKHRRLVYYLIVDIFSNDLFISELFGVGAFNASIAVYSLALTLLKVPSFDTCSFNSYSN